MESKYRLACRRLLTLSDSAAFDRPPRNELLEDSGAGHCVESGDVDGIEQALERTLFSGAAPARTRVERFQWSNLAQQYREVLEAVTMAHRDADMSVETVPAGKSLDA